MKAPRTKSGWTAIQLGKVGVALPPFYAAEGTTGADGKLLPVSLYESREDREEGLGPATLSPLPFGVASANSVRVGQLKREIREALASAEPTRVGEGFELRHVVAGFDAVVLYHNGAGPRAGEFSDFLAVLRNSEVHTFEDRRGRRRDFRIYPGNGVVSLLTILDRVGCGIRRESRW